VISLSKSVLFEKRNIFLLGLATSCGFWRVFRFVNSSAVVATANSDQFLFSVQYYPHFPNFPDTLFLKFWKKRVRERDFTKNILKKKTKQDLLAITGSQKTKEICE